MTTQFLFQYIWVMPNSSARCAQLPRAIDKVPFFAALKKFRDYLNGTIKEEEFNEEDVVFNDVKLKNFYESPEKKNLKKIKMNPEFKILEEGSTGDTDLNGELRTDGDTGKKRRGRPSKPRPDGTLPPPKRRRVDADGMPLPRGTNPIDPLTGKKKRGRPKKSETGETPPKEPKPRQSKKKQTNGFEKPESTDSAFYGNPPYPDGVSDMDSKNMKALPPLVTKIGGENIVCAIILPSPNRRGASRNFTFITTNTSNNNSTSHLLGSSTIPLPQLLASRLPQLRQELLHTVILPAMARMAMPTGEEAFTIQVLPRTTEAAIPPRPRPNPPIRPRTSPPKASRAWSLWWIRYQQPCPKTTAGYLWVPALVATRIRLDQ